MLRRLSPTAAHRILWAASQRLEDGKILDMMKIPEDIRQQELLVQRRSHFRMTPRGLSARDPAQPGQNVASADSLQTEGATANLVWKKDSQVAQSDSSPDQLDWYLFTRAGRELC